MTGFAPTNVICDSRIFAPLAVVVRETRLTIARDRSIQQRLEAGLDRMLRDIERLEETERWDGLS